MLFALLVNVFKILPRQFAERAFSHFARLFPFLISHPSMFQNAPLRGCASIRMHLNPTDIGHHRIAWLGIYESELTERIIALAEKGGTLIDVGANYGYYTLLWCSAHPDNQVVAVEASPRNLDHLRYNVFTNGFEDRVTILPWAASNEEGTVSFDLGPDTQTGWGGIVHSTTSTAVTVPSHRLDQQFHHKTFAVMKVDCEGADTLVLQGCTGLLKAKALTHIFFEENIQRMNQLGIGVEEAPKLLANHGYKVTRFGPSDLHAQVS